MYFISKVTANVFYVLLCVPDREGVGMGSSQRVPFQRAMSVDGKPLSGPGMTGRRSAPSSLIKQEHPDNHMGMGASLIFLFILT